MEQANYSEKSVSQIFSTELNICAVSEPLKSDGCPCKDTLTEAVMNVSGADNINDGSVNASVSEIDFVPTYCDVVMSSDLDCNPSQPSGKASFASEIYISPPSFSLNRASRSEKDQPTSSGFDRTDSREANASSTDTKAVLADRRSNFFSQVACCPVQLPSSVPHSSVLNLQPASDVTDPTKQSKKEAVRQHDVTTNGHSEVVSGHVQPCPGSNPSSRESLSGINDPKNVAPILQRTANEPVVIVHQAAPPSDTPEIVPLALLPTASQVVLQVDEYLPPQFCARMEPSPERFWAPSVAPLRSTCHTLQLRNNERDETRLGGSTGHLEALGDGRSGDSFRLGASSSSSAVPSPQESPLLKSVSKEPSSSTSTDSLSSTPSSANLSSQSKGGNLEKFRTFFGDNSPKLSDSKCEQISAEPSPDSLTEEYLSETKKTDLQKLPSTFDSGGKSSSSSDRSFKNKKGGWSLGGKAHGMRSPGAKPKKTMERGGDTGDSLKQKQTWKGRVARAILSYGSGPALACADVGVHGEPLGVIGVPLENCSPSSFNEFVPLIVSVCTQIVEEKGILNQGIYRVPGNTGAINQHIEEMNKDPVSLCLENEKWLDVNLVSSLLKLFFRRLPDSLITDELYESVIDANRLDNSTKRMLKLKKLLHELPEHNFETFHFLAQHLSRVASHEEVNKMDARNLAIVFGPTLVRPQDNSMVNMVKDMTDQCRIIESIILHCDWFFGSWDEDVNVPVDEEPDEQAPISGMNDELLAKAESLAVTHHVSNRDVIQTIVKAANKKLRSRSRAKATTGSMDNLDLDLESSSHSTSLSKSDIKLRLDSLPLCNVLPEELLLEVKKYPAYHFKQTYFLSTENAKPHVRRAHSNDFLSDSPSAALYGNSLQVQRVKQKIYSMPRNFSATLRSTSSEELEEVNGVLECKKNHFENGRFAT